MRDGKFQFTVSSVTNAKSVGDSVVGQTAQGEYAVLHITVTDTANATQTPAPINPGNSVRGLIYFDLPANDKTVTAQLHDSAFSGGVTVSLTH